MPHTDAGLPIVKWEFWTIRFHIIYPTLCIAWQSVESLDGVGRPSASNGLNKTQQLAVGFFAYKETCQHHAVQGQGKNRPQGTQQLKQSTPIQNTLQIVWPCSYHAFTACGRGLPTSQSEHKIHVDLETVAAAVYAIHLNGPS